MSIKEPYNKKTFEKELLSLPFCLTNYPLAPHTYYNIGGTADFVLIPKNEEETEQAYSLLKTTSCPHFVLGGGTNILISDKGFRGVILFTSQFKKFKELGDDRYFVSSGIELNWIVKEVLLKNNYEGVGALTGIPGSVGGALYMNAGTVNGYICDWVERVSLLTPNGKKEIYIKPELYSYRSQTFCSNKDVILSAIFHFKKANTNQNLIYEHYINRRKEKQPQGHCCGSVFKNPSGTHAGKLIEECGLKGTRHGGAIISPVHANFIVNENNAKFDDVFSLIQLAKTKVKEKFGIILEEEVRILFEDGCLQYCPHQTTNKG